MPVGWPANPLAFSCPYSFTSTAHAKIKNTTESNIRQCQAYAACRSETRDHVADSVQKKYQLVMHTCTRHAWMHAKRHKPFTHMYIMDTNLLAAGRFVAGTCSCTCLLHNNSSKLDMVIRPAQQFSMPYEIAIIMCSMSSICLSDYRLQPCRTMHITIMSVSIKYLFSSPATSLSTLSGPCRAAPWTPAPVPCWPALPSAPAACSPAQPAAPPATSASCSHAPGPHHLQAPALS
mmetsp:Transcript_26816/g.58472  ORF Transcript_26816/g.58472 Transcript_26816/m.58472 type:complete len:234 (-) Transcript_26816:2565-3266(-)